ncbi:alpha-L RNA-binding motif-containing protein [Microthyrium microscopicum]|uniref:Alpha-L RNA-binding motif-containing protein n=1 Tax=Microthyrium microscopicum TaxID=703497 RepID=A0A6A6U4E6_9PEZI|nr:alpha-L RNA-binding motif-containing protein [Microthyrium microscopicum]
MARKPHNFYNLKRPKIRAAWSPIDIYNILRLRRQNTKSRTFYQQKFTAKQTTRGYHGEQIREKKWQRMFSKYTPAVVEMNAINLAQQDGREQAAGRGMGLDDAVEDEQKIGANQFMPYAQMTYWTVERRLDQAIFRSLLACSVRQARQAVVHGHVKVNGQKFTHPSYLLNPGDMFSVDPQYVMHRTGTFRDAPSQEATLEAQKAEARRNRADDGFLKSVGTLDFQKEVEEAENQGTQPAWDDLPSLEEMATQAKEDVGTESTDKPFKPRYDPDVQELSMKEIKERRSTLKGLFDLSAELEDQHKLSPKQKRNLRAFRKRIRTYVAKPWILTDEEIEKLTDDLEEMIQKAELHTARMKAEQKHKPSDAEAEVLEAEEQDEDSKLLASMDNLKLQPGDINVPPEQFEQMNHLERMAVIAHTARGWSPKDWMAPFAFVPRYLEVNYTVCSAVYLRHPVVRTNVSEVPSPFPIETGQLAHAWYLRRR